MLESVASLTRDPLHEALDAGYARVSRSAGLVERRVVLAGRPVRLRVAGPRLAAQLLRPFSHLDDAPDGVPALEIRAWERDASDTGSWPAPDPSARPDAVVRKVAGSLRAHLRPRVASVEAYDLQLRIGWWCLGEGSETPWFDRAAPFRSILNWWAEDAGCLLLHAGAVGTPEMGAILVAGRAGSGKSTACCGCLGSSLQFVSEDIVLVTASPTPVVHSVHHTAKLTPESRRRLPHLGIEPLTGPEDEKFVAFAHELFPDGVASQLPLRGIVFPSVTERGTRILPMRRAEALRRLAPDSLLLRSGARSADAFQRIADVVGRLPSYLLEVGPRPESAAEALADCLRRLT